MKYTSTLHHTQRKEVQVFAADSDEALRLLRESHPGFTADEVTELGEGDEPGATHAGAGTCEYCDKTLWEGPQEKHHQDDDGVMLCDECHAALLR